MAASCFQAGAQEAAEHSEMTWQGASASPDCTALCGEPGPHPCRTQDLSLSLSLYHSTVSWFTEGSSIPTALDRSEISDMEGVRPCSHLSPTAVWPYSSRNVPSPLCPRGNLVKLLYYYNCSLVPHFTVMETRTQSEQGWRGHRQCQRYSSVMTKVI